MNLPLHIKNIIKLSAENEEDFKAVFTREELPKGHFLYRQGDICRLIFYIDKGFARTYYNSNSGKEITAGFQSENSFLVAVDSFYHHKPTFYTCKLLEDSIVYSMKYCDFENIMGKYPEFSKFAFQITYDIAKRLSEFVVRTKFQTAEERYTSLMEEYPIIFQRASLVHIASYLGITKETLSRIRAGK